METFDEILSTQLSKIVRAGRLGDYGDASAALNKCIAVFEAFQTNPLLGGASGPLLKKLNFSLKTIVLMLGYKDWVAISDIVEYEVLPLWNKIRPVILQIP